MSVSGVFLNLTPPYHSLRLLFVCVCVCAICVWVLCSNFLQDKNPPIFEGSSLRRGVF